MDIFLVTYYDMESWVCLGKEEVKESINKLFNWEGLVDIYDILDDIVIKKVVHTGWLPEENNPTYTGKEFLEDYGL